MSESPRWGSTGRVVLLVFACSLLLGVGGRVGMAVLAAVQGTRPGFTLGGTLEVISTGVIIGVPAGLALLVGRLRVWRSGRFLGAIGGGLLFLGLALVPPPAARSASTGVSSTVLIVALVLFGILFVSWGVTLVAAVDQMFGMGRSGESTRDGL